MAILSRDLVYFQSRNASRICKWELCEHIIKALKI